uniref:Uncharacterized protein n=1 Tax=Sinocyclocheilus grahami TaxID=75366 RepID=A0A672LKV1_SINGR
MSSFFIKKKVISAAPNKGDLKRKSNADDGKGRSKKFSKRMDEEISSDSENESADPSRKQQENEDDEIEETPQEKKLRLAKLYLEQLREEEDKKAEQDSFEADLIAGRLQDDVVGPPQLAPDPAEIRLLRGHKLPVTCLVITPDEKYIFSASKDCSIIKWEVESGKKAQKIAGGRKGTEARHVGHTAHVLCMAISSDGKYLASGDLNKLIMIWDPMTCKHLYKFKGHREAVSGLAFRRGTHTLYSASHDRSIKVWSVDENAYVETLFGHQDMITGLDCLSRERFCDHDLSLIMTSKFGPVNSISIWTVNKKKPVSTVKQAHGSHGNTGLEQPYWVSSVAALHNSDIVASGSHNSAVQLWKCGQGFRGLEPLFSVPMTGFVNSLKFSNSGKFLVAGVGQEHRLGRWWRIKEARNGIYIIPLKRQAQEQEVVQ